MALTPDQRILRARIGAYALHAKHDARETTRKARVAFLRRFELEVDPNGTLPAPERERRARAALKAHMAALALKSSRARGPRSVAPRVDLPGSGAGVQRSPAPGLWRPHSDSASCATASP